MEEGLRRRARRRKTGELEVAHAGKRSKSKDGSEENLLVAVKNRVESDRNAKSGSLRRQSGFMGKMREPVKRPSSPVRSPDPPGRRRLHHHHLLLSRTLCLHPEGTVGWGVGLG